MARDPRFATEREPADDLDEDSLDREDLGTAPEDEGELAVAIRLARIDLKGAQTLLDGLRAQRDGDQKTADAALAEHNRLKQRVATLSAQIGGEHVKR